VTGLTAAKLLGISGMTSIYFWEMRKQLNCKRRAPPSNPHIQVGQREYLMTILGF
jgi:hypothetical protein